MYSIGDEGDAVVQREILNSSHMCTGVKYKGLRIAELTLRIFPKSNLLQIYFCAVGDVEVNGAPRTKTGFGIADANGTSCIATADAGTSETVAN